MDLHSAVRRRPGVVLLAVAAVAALLGGVMRADPAEAGGRVMPGSFTGYAFDACQAPSQDAMDVWLERSPYWGVGIYIAGDNRYCAEQHNLDADWVAQQTRKGWRLLPLTVGRQASCSVPKRWTKISPDGADGYAKARSQGRAEARTTVAAARGYGIAEGSTLWLDMEAFDIHRTRCRESALAFVSAWTTRLHDLGWRSGFYSSASSGIRMLDEIRVSTPRKYALPDRIWLADWNQRQDTRSTYFATDGWTPHRRVHQYAGGHRETWGGVSINIDSNFLDVGRGSVAPKAGPHCGVRREFGSYSALRIGARGDLVAALQCFLHQQRFGPVSVDGRFGVQTAAAVRRFQRSHGLPVTGAVNRRGWMVLVAGGTTPLVKYGAANDAVRRVQRALNAASGAQLAVTGVFEGRTRAAVKRYQEAVRMPRSGVVTGSLWVLLQRGVR